MCVECNSIHYIRFYCFSSCCCIYLDSNRFSVTFIHLLHNFFCLSTTIFFTSLKCINIYDFHAFGFRLFLLYFDCIADFQKEIGKIIVPIHFNRNGIGPRNKNCFWWMIDENVSELNRMWWIIWLQSNSYRFYFESFEMLTAHLKLGVFISSNLNRFRSQQIKQIYLQIKTMNRTPTSLWRKTNTRCMHSARFSFTRADKEIISALYRCMIFHASSTFFFYMCFAWCA